MEKGILMILSGPSGCGKGTLVNLLKEDKNIEASISATTRQKRQGEIDKVDYYFLKKEEFLNKLENDEFLEYNEYCNNYYGTLKSEVKRLSDLGKDVILEIDVCGAKQIEKESGIVKVFVLPPSLNELRTRLSKRASESEEEIKNRIKRAKEEIKEIESYDYIIINDSLEDAVCKLKSIFEAEKNKKENMIKKIEGEILNEFE